MFEDSKRKMKEDILFKQFSDYGYCESTKISRSELLLFLNRKSSNGKFDENICQKLFEFLDIKESNTITVGQFVYGVLDFESQYINNVESIKSQFLQQQNIYNSLLEHCQKYKNSKYNEHGFCEGAKFYGEIVNVQFKNYLEATENIILTLSYNGQKKEIRQKYSQNGNVMLNAQFEFRAQSKNENFKFNLQGDMGYGYVYELGTKTYALSEINNQEEFYVKIPIFGQIEQKIIAEINAKICMIWSFFKLFEERRIIEEPKLNQLRLELEEAEEQLKRVSKIYDKKVHNSLTFEEKRENINLNESKRSKKGIISFQDRDNRNNNKFEFPGKNFSVKFNFIRMNQNKNKGMNVDFLENMNFEIVDKSYQTINLEQSHFENDQKNIQNNKISNNYNNMNFSQNQKKENNFQRMKQMENIDVLGTNVELERSFGANMLEGEIQSKDVVQEENQKQNDGMYNVNKQNIKQNCYLNNDLSKKSNISQKYNRIQNSNMLLNSKNSSQNPDISQKINEIQNSNKLQKSNVLKNSQNSHHSNSLQDSNIIQNSNVIHQSNLLRNSNSSNNFNETQIQNIHKNSNILQQTNATQNSNMNQQFNQKKILNMIQQSNEMKNGNMTQQTNVMTNQNMIQQTSVLNKEHILQQSNDIKRANIIQQPIQEDNSKNFPLSNGNSNTSQDSNMLNVNKLKKSNFSHLFNVNQNIITNNPFDSINAPQNMSQNKINVSSSNFPIPSYNNMKISQGQNLAKFQNPIINKNLSEIGKVQEDTLPEKYLSEKLSVSNPLPLSSDKKNINYSVAQSNFNDNLLGRFQINQYNPTILSYQKPTPNEKQYHSIVFSLKKV